MTPSDYPQARERMVHEEVLGRGVSDPRVIRALRDVPRHLFVAAPMARSAYGPSALPIGSGQTISAPHMVGLMSEALRLTGAEKVLEIGAGSGYQAAVLSRLARNVITVERIPDLAREARERLEGLGYRNVVVRVGDGTLGAREYGAFDRILVTAGGPKVPRSLVEQLVDGGILVIPVGDRESQVLLRVTRKGDGVTEEQLCRCVFVPLLGREGFSPES